MARPNASVVESLVAPETVRARAPWVDMEPGTPKPGLGSILGG